MAIQTHLSITHQDALFLRYVHPDTHEPATVFAGIKCFKKQDFFFTDK